MSVEEAECTNSAFAHRKRVPGRRSLFSGATNRLSDVVPNTPENFYFGKAVSCLYM